MPSAHFRDLTLVTLHSYCLMNLYLVHLVVKAAFNLLAKATFNLLAKTVFNLATEKKGVILAHFGINSQGHHSLTMI